MKKNVLRKRIILFVTVLLSVSLIVWVIWGNSALVLNTVTVASKNLPKSFSGFRIAHVSDLHNTQMGDENEKLLSLIKSANPDIIALTGDIIDSRDTDVDIALDFVKNAVEIAPCYYVTGNHEARVGADFEKLESGLGELGVMVLRNDKTALEYGGEKITIIGLDDRAFGIDVDRILESLSCEEDSFTLLFSHRPELFDTYVKNEIDLTLSGHAHGGQIRLPFVGGIVAPGQGLFPKYDAGLYTEGDSKMVVSRGIGNSIVPLRFNNRPEVILIELKAE